MKKLHTLLAAIVALSSSTTLRAADETPTYPLKTCVVSGEALDSMGKPYVFTYEGQEVQFCCKECKKTFDKDPEQYLKKIEAAKSGDSSASASDAHAEHH